MIQYKDLKDIELFRKIAKYDSRALEELYDRYSPILYSLIKKIAPDQYSAENILVEVFAIIWRKMSKFDFETGNVYTWLINLARNRAIDSLRRSRSSYADLDFYNDKFENFYIIPLLDANIEPLDLETAGQMKPRIEKALSKLGDAQKYIIQLSFYEGYNLNEISQKLSVPIETVRTQVLTAVNNLHNNFLED